MNTEVGTELSHLSVRLISCFQLLLSSILSFHCSFPLSLGILPRPSWLISEMEGGSNPVYAVSFSIHVYGSVIKLNLSRPSKKFKAATDNTK